MDNIEKSAFRRGQYIGWSTVTGKQYRIRKSNDKPGAVWWCAICIDGTDVLHARTLKGISLELDGK